MLKVCVNFHSRFWFVYNFSNPGNFSEYHILHLKRLVIGTFTTDQAELVRSSLTFAYKLY